MSDQLEKKKLMAQLTYNEKQKKLLQDANCDRLSRDSGVRDVVIRVANAVGAPLNISLFRRIACEILLEEPAVAKQFANMGADEGTRRSLAGLLVDATFTECLTNCLVHI